MIGSKDKKVETLIILFFSPCLCALWVLLTGLMCHLQDTERAAYIKVTGSIVKVILSIMFWLLWDI